MSVSASLPAIDKADDLLCSLDCDYITVRGPDTRVPGGLHKLASACFRSEADCGNTPRPWGMAGYKGFKCGEVEIGTLDQDVIVRMHSGSAARNWSRLVPLCERVTRFDVQATVKVKGSVTDRLNRHREEALAHSEKHQGRLIVRRIDDNQGGYTLYLGARESNVFGRLYDKWAKSKEEEFIDCLRYEVQFNSRLANSIAHTLHRMSCPKPGFGGYLAGFLDGRGVAPPSLGYASLQSYWPRKRTGSDRKLLWLEEAVRPTVLALIALGRGEETLRALGLVQVDDLELDHVDQHNTEKG